jgi:molybdate transport system ATP-binding protein
MTKASCKGAFFRKPVFSMQVNYQEELAVLSNVSVNTGGQTLLHNINLSVKKGEQWAIIGHSGSGKTTLAQVLAGQIFYSGERSFYFPANTNSHIELVAQQHHFKNLSNTRNFYYQQRFNAAEADDSITAGEALINCQVDEHWIHALHLGSLLHESLLQLSNGENKRLQLAMALSTHPALLILDNPFLGLDTAGRQTLHSALDGICEKGIQLILITSAPELPACITHIAVLQKGQLKSVQTRAVYLQQAAVAVAVQPDITLLQQMPLPAGTDFVMAVQMQQVSIRYGDKIILDKIDWSVKKGECWSLSGPNGAGKSTLLSLITADNPQAYANKIVLFDRQRGSGESIWDIKNKIGFVSPELHLFFEQTATCFEVIASGLFDTIGLFRRLSEEQQALVLRWMQLMSLTPLRHKRIFQLSSSEQRMALLARALVKNPPMLILDEPAQGLDEWQTVYFKNLVDEICRHFGTTLIYVSHYTSELPSCINRFLRLSGGAVQR